MKLYSKYETFKWKHTHDFIASITALFNQKQSNNYLCILLSFY